LPEEADVKVTPVAVLLRLGEKLATAVGKNAPCAA
jgi:hypothetical protein